MTKENFTEILKNLGVSKKEFAEICKISYMTVNNWNDDNRPIPDWVEPFLFYYEKGKTLDELLAIIKKYEKPL